MAAELYARIGAAIRSKRGALGLSQAQLAKRVGLGRTSITMIEQGSQSLLVHQLLQFASALRTTPAELLSEAAHERQLDLEPPESDAAEVDSLLRDLEKSVRRITKR